MTPSFSNVGVLGIVVLIQTFLSIPLGVEIEAHWPWHRRDPERAVEGRSRQLRRRLAAQGFPSLGRRDSRFGLGLEAGLDAETLFE